MSSAIKWLDLLGWTEEEMNDLRFVAYSYIKQGHYKTALKFFEALAVLCPHSAYDLQTLGALYLETGDNLTALNYLDRSLQIEAKPPPDSFKSRQSSPSSWLSQTRNRSRTPTTNTYGSKNSRTSRSSDLIIHLIPIFHSLVLN
jgi:tetratricopeptide (TPR) repeat protein